MADRGRHTLATDNVADVIENGKGHRVPDTFGTGDNPCKMGDTHASLIHDPYERYGPDATEGYTTGRGEY